MNTVLSILISGILFSLITHRICYKERDKILSRSFMRILFLFLLTLLSLLLYNQVYSIPHLVLGETLCTPGSLVTRGINLPLTYYLRRLLEPSILLFYFCFGIYAHTFKDKSSKILLTSGLAIGMLTLIFESLILSSQAFMVDEIFSSKASQYTWSISLLLLLLAILRDTFKKDSFKLSRRKTLITSSVIISSGLFFIGLLFGLIYPHVNNQGLKNIFVHYYLWFPENWNAGYEGQRNLDTSLKPYPDEYSSDDPEIIEQHISQMKEAGITHVLIDWWPRRPHLKNRAIKFASALEDDGNIKFALHLETFDILKNDSKKLILLGENEIAILKAFFEHLIKRVRNYSNYYKINGKPVVFLYASRHLKGDVNKALIEVRNYIKDKFNLELYLVGDEIFYNVPDTKTGRLLPKYIPSWERIRAFDAITFYNPYNPHENYAEGDAGINILIQEYKNLLIKYRAISETAGVPIIPTIIPGYNDKVIRPKNIYLPVERKLTTEKSVLDLLYQTQDEILGLSKTDSIIITSWNEWNEGTQIEPARIGSTNHLNDDIIRTLRNWRKQ